VSAKGAGTVDFLLRACESFGGSHRTRDAL
jgi:hypothetical protein